ncbi:MAG: hypothetical protein ABI648_09430 [Betaproteobacteria bacterium]
MRLLLLILVLGGCTMSTPIHYTDGKPAQLIECGAAVAWSVCYTEANNACPKGYEVLREEAGFNRKSLTVRCK